MLCARIESGAVDQDIAAGDGEMGKTAVRIEAWHAGGERGAVGIDEATTRTGNPVGVGDDHVGLPAEDFGEAGERAAPGRHDFVQDDAGFGREVYVGHDLTGELRLARDLGRVAIVEHEAN